jgi:beta-lactamase superfamily II metal-dependent hydrolase
VSVVKSFATGLGDTFYIRHDSDAFTIIDCRIVEGREDVLAEIRELSAGKAVTRFISTHPGHEHIRGLARLDDAIDLRHFYVVENHATQPEDTADFERYRELHDSTKALFLERGCLSESGAGRGSAGIEVLWPVLENPDFQAALLATEEGGSPNNLSTILSYGQEAGVRMLWFGDLETDFMARIEDEIELPRAEIVFVARHGRARLPAKWIEQIDPKVIVLGEASAADLAYYEGRDHIRQEATGDITFECLEGVTHIYVEDGSYEADFLEDRGISDRYGMYLGSIASG